MNEPRNLPRPLRVPAVAAALGCSERTVRRLLERRELRGFRIGADWRVTPEALAEYRDGPADMAD